MLEGVVSHKTSNYFLYHNVFNIIEKENLFFLVHFLLDVYFIL